MNKIKNIFTLLVIGLVLYSCGDDNNNRFVNPYANVDYKALAISDNDSIVKFLKNNYYDATLDSVKAITSGETSLLDDDKLKTMNVTENDINYKLYVYVAKEGIPKPEKGNPTVADSIFAKYFGVAFVGSKLGNSFDSNQTGKWFNLLTNGVSGGVIRGWSYGFTKFKNGELMKDPVTGGVFNGPITYLNGGKGVLFIPSGLAYPSIHYIPGRTVNSLFNLNLMFYVELLDFVKDTDHDRDGTPSIDEDADGNGDPRNDFSDTKRPKIPDYLNPNIK
ncbi:MAG: FKBP-type peptidyl-prolyl cis-trans isomerase [Polaribacter sp.]